MNRLDLMKLWMQANGCLHHLSKPKLDRGVKDDLISRLLSIQEDIERYTGELTVMDCYLALEAKRRNAAKRKQAAGDEPPFPPMSQPHGPQGGDASS